MKKQLFFAMLSFCIGTMAISFPSAVFAQSKSGSTGQAIVTTTISLSQVYSGGGGASGTYMHDYVELKNVSGSPQSLNGLKLVYGSGTGQFASSSNNAFTLPDVTLAPGQYYLVQTSSAGSGGSAFPVTPDATTSGLSMGANAGKVALVTAAFTNNSCGATATPCSLPNVNIIDLLAWGTSNNAEGGTALSGLTATNGAVRKEAGCLDTDRNDMDFDVVGSPVPRNSGSSYNACGTSGGGQSTKVPMDFDGDGKTDYAVIRVGQTQPDWLRWYISMNETWEMTSQDWGTVFDTFVPADYDGDGKTDHAVWRPGAVGQFFIINSSDFTFTTHDFGQTGDDPTVVADYNGDGKIDIAVYREGSGSEYSYWYWKTAPNEYFEMVAWGQAGDKPLVGDFNGDGLNDPMIVREGPNGENQFWVRYSAEDFTSFNYGEYLDILVTGDYTGDGTDDIVVVSIDSDRFKWSVLPSEGGEELVKFWGVPSNGDLLTPGDFNGDGMMDYAIWRPDASFSTFYSVTSGDFEHIVTRTWGIDSDVPVGIYNVR